MRIVLFDGDCAFCSTSVLFILKNSRTDDLLVCPSESNEGRTLINQHSILAKPEDTLIYLKENKVFIKSSAVLQIVKKLKGLYPLLIVFGVIPRPFRDWCYDTIARNRKKIWKKNSNKKRAKCDFELANRFKKRVVSDKMLASE